MYPNSLKIIITSRNERAFVKNQAIFNILDSLKEKIPIEYVWILYPTEKQTDYKKPKLDYDFKFFEEYKTNNIKKILEIEKPDLLITSNDFEYFGRSFVLAAKEKKIPTVLLLQRIFSEVYMDQTNTSLVKGRVATINKRGSFLLKKYKILLKTYFTTQKNFIKIIYFILRDFIQPFLDTEPSGKFGCDLILTNDDTTSEVLKKRGIKTKVVITGDPGLDTTYKKISRLNKKQNHSKIKVVLITTGYVEHGVWTKNMWNSSLNQILSAVKDEEEKIDFSIKIHPVTERKEEYEKIVHKSGLKIPIYQTENLMKIYSESDVIVSLGTGSWAIVEAVLMEKKVLAVNFFNESIENLPYVKYEVASEVKNVENFYEKILTIHSSKISKEKRDLFIEKYLYKFDGKSSERSAEAILKLFSAQ